MDHAYPHGEASILTAGHIISLCFQTCKDFCDFFLGEREKEGRTEREGERERQTERENPTQTPAVSAEPNAGLDPTSREIMT